MRRAIRLSTLLVFALVFPSCAGPSARLRQEADRVVAAVQEPQPPARVRDFQRACHSLAEMGLAYRFGGADPAGGGLDCSGAVRAALVRVGYRSVPRQSNHQYHWLATRGSLRRISRLDSSTISRLRPGDLMFWKGTHSSGPRWPDVTHVMVYMGRDPKTGKHWMFGGRGTRRTGRNGHGIDFFPLDPATATGYGRFVGYGPVPGMRR